MALPIAGSQDAPLAAGCGEPDRQVKIAILNRITGARRVPVDTRRPPARVAYITEKRGDPFKIMMAGPKITIHSDGKIRKTIGNSILIGA